MRKFVRPDRKGGAEVSAYLLLRYILTEIFYPEALETVSGNVVRNEYMAAKFSVGALPVPIIFQVENSVKASCFTKNGTGRRPSCGATVR